MSVGELHMTLINTVSLVGRDHALLGNGTYLWASIKTLGYWALQQQAGFATRKHSLGLPPSVFWEVSGDNSAQ